MIAAIYQPNNLHYRCLQATLEWLLMRWMHMNCNHNVVNIWGKIILGRKSCSFDQFMRWQACTTKYISHHSLRLWVKYRQTSILHQKLCCPNKSKYFLLICSKKLLLYSLKKLVYICLVRLENCILSIAVLLCFSKMIIITMKHTRFKTIYL